jgi:hypothetical protein
MSDDKITRLAADAVQWKKAWVMGIAILGNPANEPPDSFDVPNYLHWQIKPLKRELDCLRQDLDEIGKHLILEDWNSAQRNKTVLWLATKHDEWVKSRQHIWELGRVHEIEQAIGRLGSRNRVECPAYAQVLIQGFNAPAIRHPEYHLARDLALLNNLFLDAEAIAAEHQKNRRLHSNEISQSLGRSTILTCYNLLESFLSGLVAAFIIENPNAPQETIKKLEKPKDRTLKARFVEVPALITGVPNVMEPFRSVLTPLFGDHQKRRNAFVHCEPGPVTPKEAFFHETNARIVRETVSLTIRAIRAAWKVIHKTDGPRWLPDPDPKGRFLIITANLTEPRHTIPNPAESSTR